MWKKVFIGRPSCTRSSSACRQQSTVGCHPMMAVMKTAMKMQASSKRSARKAKRRQTRLVAKRLRRSCAEFLPLSAGGGADQRTKFCFCAEACDIDCWACAAALRPAAAMAACSLLLVVVISCSSPVESEPCVPGKTRKTTFSAVDHSQTKCSSAAYLSSLGGGRRHTNAISERRRGRRRAFREQSLRTWE